MGNGSRNSGGQQGKTGNTQQNTAAPASSPAPAPSAPPVDAAAAAAAPAGSSDINTSGAGTEQTGTQSNSGTAEQQQSNAEQTGTNNEQQQPQDNAQQNTQLAEGATLNSLQPGATTGPLGPDVTAIDPNAGTQQQTSEQDNSAHEPAAADATPPLDDEPTHNQVVALAHYFSESAVSIEAKLALQTIEEYIRQLQPNKPIEDLEVARLQRTLYMSLKNIINIVDEDFARTWAAVLQLFHGGRYMMFSQINVYRGMPQVDLKPKEREAFTRLVNMCLVTADPQSRAFAKRQVDFTRTTEFEITDLGRNKIASFYGA